MEIKVFLTAKVNEEVFDLVSELSLIKYSNYPHPVFLVDIQATRKMNGQLDELLSLINVNNSDCYTADELLNSQYVHVEFARQPSERTKNGTTQTHSTIVKQWLNANISKDKLDVLSNNASADIWYDAGDHGDTEAQRIIEETQCAMDNVSSIISNMMDS